MNKTGLNTVSTPFLTPDDLADYLKISKTSVYRIIDKRSISFYKVKGSIRFDKQDVLEYLKKNRIELV